MGLTVAEDSLEDVESQTGINGDPGTPELRPTTMVSQISGAHKSIASNFHE